jgi:hypothetical protein
MSGMTEMTQTSRATKTVPVARTTTHHYAAPLRLLIRPASLWTTCWTASASIAITRLEFTLHYSSTPTVLRLPRDTGPAWSAGWGGKPSRCGFGSHQDIHDILSNTDIMSYLRRVQPLEEFPCLQLYTTRVFPAPIMQKYSTRIFLVSTRSLRLVGGKAPRPPILDSLARSPSWMTTPICWSTSKNFPASSWSA